jgi:hypothetical protein
MEIQVYELIKKDSHAGDLFERLTSEFKENIIPSLGLNKENDKSIILYTLEGIARINWSSEDPIPSAIIYNAENSQEKIHNLKSLIEEKTGWKFK